MSERQLRLLLIEDSADDAHLISRSLERGGYMLAVTRVDTGKGLRAALVDGSFDLAITDHELQGFDSAAVLAELADLAPELPSLLVSGKVGEEVVGQAMRGGAADYVSKDNLGRLPPAVERTLVEGERDRERSGAEQALARSGRLFEAVFANARDAMLIVDDQRRLIDSNPAAAELVAMPHADLLKLRIEDLLPETVPADPEQRWMKILLAGERRGELEILRDDGELIATEYTAAANFLPGRHIIVLRDIRERRAAEVEVRRRVSQQQAITALGEVALREKGLDLLMDLAVTRVAETLDVAGAAILELRADESSFRVRAEAGSANARVGGRLPYRPEVRSLESFTVTHDGFVLVSDFETETRFERTPTLKARGIRSALSVVIAGSEGPYGVLAAGSSRLNAFDRDDASFLTAVSHLLADALARVSGEEEIRRQSLRDPLTGLANRTLFYDRLSLALARAKRMRTRVAVAFVDLDHFKTLNDTLGHRAGDDLLIEVGVRIEAKMRDTDTVARLGGDEFVVLCEDLDDAKDAELLAMRLLKTLDAPFVIDGAEHAMSASIGVALSDSDNLEGETLVRDADLALYQSKDRGRGRWTVATEAMRAALALRTQTKDALRRAISSEELVLHYQPIVALDGGAICAVEALVRWEDPERGLIPPGQFIPLAEESGLIVELGEWVLRAACRQAADWRAQFGEDAPLPIHVNVSARQIAAPNLSAVVRQVLTETGVPPADIALEITETSLIENVGVSITTLSELRSMGLSTVLDDFGTGYSSLAYLERFPVDTLKVDRSFVSPLESPGSAAPIVTAIVGMARALSVRTVAEGVETAEQTAAVAALGCQWAQGYFFARPGPASRITELIRDDSPLRERAAEASALTLAVGDSGGDGPVGGRVRAPESVAEHRQAMLAALLAADSEAAMAVVSAALGDEIGLGVIDSLIIGAAMIEIGHLWERGEVSVAQEHLATGIASQAAAAGAAGAAASLTVAPGAANGRPMTVLLASAEGDDHVLGLRMVADMLLALGFNVRYLAGRLPGAELCKAALDFEPDVIGLSLTMPELASKLGDQAAALRAVCPDSQLLLGGQGISAELVEKTGGVFIRDVDELMRMAVAWPRPAVSAPRVMTTH